MTRLAAAGYRAGVVSATEDEQRIAREEREWGAPRMFVLGFGFLAACIALILAMSYLSSPRGYSLIPWW